MRIRFFSALPPTPLFGTVPGRKQEINVARCSLELRLRRLACLAFPPSRSESLCVCLSCSVPSKCLRYFREGGGGEPTGPPYASDCTQDPAGVLPLKRLSMGSSHLLNKGLPLGKDRLPLPRPPSFLCGIHCCLPSPSCSALRKAGIAPLPHGALPPPAPARPLCIALCPSVCACLARMRPPPLGAGGEGRPLKLRKAESWVVSSKIIFLCVVREGLGKERRDSNLASAGKGGGEDGSII